MTLQNFASRYKVRPQQEWVGDLPKAGESRKALKAAWLEIPGKWGRVFQWAPETLAAYCPAGPLKRKQLKALGGTWVLQEGDWELVVGFPPEHLEVVAAVLGLRRKRVLSPERRQRQREALAVARARRGQKPCVGGGMEGQGEDGPPVNENLLEALFGGLWTDPHPVIEEAV